MIGLVFSHIEFIQSERGNRPYDFTATCSSKGKVLIPSPVGR
jgi:hypothetical protein